VVEVKTLGRKRKRNGRTFRSAPKHRVVNSGKKRRGSGRARDLKIKPLRAWAKGSDRPKARLGLLGKISLEGPRGIR